ncbi:Protein CBG21637 [Caenorhabditis briggsae]|uniref:Protein CBG21637 n=1 Tax=Caenorhabditis briggsae TaxID=6238 RepID=A8Y094_CAEBR|nr:Protein CBG21637 [Caenorhabditis briggsae]CAP38384.1 Protein CBG21637 [Caenorhabditis briggsae]
MEVDPPNTALSPTTVVHPSHIPKLIKRNAIEDKEKITVADGQEYLKRQREDDWIENRVARNRVERRQAGKIIKKHKRELEKKQEKLRDEMEELHLDKI